MSPIVKQALLEITDCINTYTGLTHRDDRDRTVQMLSQLHLAGETLDAGEITSQAATYGWRPPDADELGELAAKITGGARVRMAKQPFWPANTVEWLRGRMALVPR
jgi:hypothetical protein